MKTGCLLESPAGRAEPRCEARPSPYRLIHWLMLGILFAGCRGSSPPQGHRIEVRIMDTEAHSFRTGFCFVDIRKGEDEETSQSVTSRYVPMGKDGDPTVYFTVDGPSNRGNGGSGGFASGRGEDEPTRPPVINRYVPPGKGRDRTAPATRDGSAIRGTVRPRSFDADLVPYFTGDGIECTEPGRPSLPDGGQIAAFDVTEPGVYWVSVTPYVFVDECTKDDSFSLTVPIHDLPKDTAARQARYRDAVSARGYYEGAPSRGEAKGNPYTITSVKIVPLGEASEPEATKGQMKVELAVTIVKRYRYLPGSTCVRTHVAENEPVDHALAIIPTAPESIGELHRRMKNLAAKNAVYSTNGLISGDPGEQLKATVKAADPLIADFLEKRLGPMTWKGKTLLGAGVTTVIDVGTAGRLNGSDLLKDVAEGALLSCVIQGPGALFVASIAIAKFEDKYIFPRLDARKLREYGASDDLEATCFGKLGHGPLEGQGTVRVQNHGERIYNAHVVAVEAFPAATPVWQHHPLPASPRVSTPQRADVPPGEERFFDWYISKNSISEKSFRYLALCYQTYPGGAMLSRAMYKRDKLEPGDLCGDTGVPETYEMPLEVLVDKPPAGALRITGFSTHVLPSSRMTGREVRLFVVHVKNMGVEPAYLRLSTTDDDYRCSPEIIAEREAAGAKGPYRLGLEYRNQAKKNGPWELMSVLRASPGWTLLEKCEKDVHFFGSIVSQAYLDPGQTRTVALFSDDLEPTWRVFILRPTCARSDTKTIEEKDLAQ